MIQDQLKIPTSVSANFKIPAGVFGAGSPLSKEIPSWSIITTYSKVGILFKSGRWATGIWTLRDENSSLKFVFMEKINNTQEQLIYVE